MEVIDRRVARDTAFLFPVDAGGEMAVLVSLDDDVFLGTRFESEPHREGDIATIEVLLLLKRELELRPLLQ